jgi:hypothetical protein
VPGADRLTVTDGRAGVTGVGPAAEPGGTLSGAAVSGGKDAAVIPPMVVVVRFVADPGGWAVSKRVSPRFPPVASTTTNASRTTAPTIMPGSTSRHRFDHHAATPSAHALGPARSRSPNPEPSREAGSSDMAATGGTSVSPPSEMRRRSPSAV